MVHLSAIPAIAIALGAVLGLGAWLVIASTPRLGRARLVDRVAPYITDFSAEARAMRSRPDADPGSVLGMLIMPMLRGLRSGLNGLLGGNETVARRLRQAGVDATVERFRGEQLAWAGLAFALGAALALFAPSFVAMPPVVRAAVPAVAAVAGAVTRDWLLQRSARRRLARISSELPTMLEFLTLSLTAGEGMLEALRRVARTGSGELPTEFARVVAAVGAGVPLPTALAELRDGLEHAALSRALDQVLGALDRGAPLADVLRSQAGDARAESKRTIIELAGRKEIAMLVPLIFLILPVTIAFALFPGYLVLQAGF
ncbi:tight adherence protein C [Agromyces flavus]|uniref:Tight adherence protein C n=1 Tax=Agromyces flavus TaxID=589382 RepID=A0A1H1PAW6_9MICO|nr:type II secretion system F family protein [Agromyces flavus]MCP2367969.1 tight adherence protein C [Agromyces flavus]GGI47431.1 pilus assembly protein TadB [Agromyces flavus]SDS07759.1 tight adherence protein C [Agromyces flavus]